MEVKGVIIASLDEQGGTSKAGTAWRSKDYVLETAGKYPKKVCFNLYGANIDKYVLEIGQEVNVHFDIESREWEGRWFTTVRAWKVDREGVSPNPIPPVSDEVMEGAGDNLPF